MKNKFEYGIIFILGAVLYCLLEILWRGYTHWTMAITGGICFLVIYLINYRMRETNLLLRCFVGSAVITVAEFSVGCLVNRVLCWDVWDYSDMRCNLLGQVCLLYTLIWFFVCIPAAPLCRCLYDFLNGKESTIKRGVSNIEK